MWRSWISIPYHPPTPHIRWPSDPGAVEAKATAWMNVVNIGRAHLDDTVPLCGKQEWSSSMM